MTHAIGTPTAMPTVVTDIVPPVPRARPANGPSGCWEDRRPADARTARFLSLATSAAALVAVVAVAVLPAPAAAQAADSSRTAFEARTTRDLATLCGMSPQAADYASAIAFCHGFLQGAGQYHAAITQPGSGRTPLFCAPTPPPSRAQVAEAFVAWARANPASAGESAVDGLTRWASAAYPCPTTQPLRR